MKRIIFKLGIFLSVIFVMVGMNIGTGLFQVNNEAYAIQSTVVDSLYYIGGNGARKIVQLNNGTLMSVMFDTSTGLKVYKSIN